MAEEAKDQGGPEVQDKDKPKPDPMKRGDYMIHVFVEQAKQLKVAPGDVVDPLIEIGCMGAKKFSSNKEKIDNTAVINWNEHIFMEFSNKEPNELEKAKVSLKMLDKGIFKDEMLGYYEFDLSYIYLQPDHALLHKWVVMSNPEGEDFSEVTAYFKMSITVSGVGDPNVAIEDDPNPEKEDVIQPPQVKPEFYQIIFRFFTLEQIVPMDTNLTEENSTDAYVRLDYRSKKMKTKVLDNTKTTDKPSWNQEFLVPVQLPLMTSRIVFKVFDEDLVCDEIIGSIHLDLKDIMDEDHRDGYHFWKNIYGAPLGVSGDTTDQMNENPECGSLFKGRILMQTIAKKVEKPKFLIQDCEEDVVAEAKPYWENDRQYQVLAFIQAGIGLPKDEKLKVEIRIAEKSIITSSGSDKDNGAVKINKDNGNYARFCYTNYKKDQKELSQFQLPYVNCDDIGQVFIYLVYKEKRICYARLPVTDFYDPDSDIRWIEMQPDKAIGVVKENYQAGIIGVKIYITEMNKPGTYWDAEIGEQVPHEPYFSPESNKKWKPLIKPMLRLPIWKVRAYIFQCRDLPAADSDGTSDPCIKIHGDGTKGQGIESQTAVIEDNMNPLFYQALEITVESIDNKNMDQFPPMILDCLDEDESTITKNKLNFMCRSVIPINKLSYSTGDLSEQGTDNIFEPKWYDMSTGAGMPASGAVLASFCIVKDDHKFKANNLKHVDLEGMVAMDDFDVSINILGLRNLLSPGLLPVKKAFIAMNAKSLVSPKQGINVQNIKTEPRNPGPNPTLNTTLSFNVPLPTEKLYTPRLACQVFDTIFAGFSQPIIGNFVVPIGEIMHDIIKEREEETNAIEEVIKQIKLIEKDQAVGAVDYKKNYIQQELPSPSYKAGLDNRKLITSINADEEEYNDTTGLLNTANDHDEENRQEKGLKDKDEAASFAPREAQLSNRAQAAKKMGLDGLTNQKGDALKPDAQTKAEMKREAAEKKEKLALQIEDERKKAAEKFNESHKGESHRNVILPQYEWDNRFMVNREQNKPSIKLFLGLGWDRDDVIFKNPEEVPASRAGSMNSNQIHEEEEGAEADAPLLNDDDKKPENENSALNVLQKKHYRRFFPQALETVKEIMPEDVNGNIKSTPFYSYPLKRGQTRGAKAGLWASLTGSVKKDASGEVSTEKIVGKFKAVIEVETKEARDQYEQTKAELFDDLTSSIKKLARQRKVDIYFKSDLEEEMRKNGDGVDIISTKDPQKIVDFETDLETIESRERIELMFDQLGIRRLEITKKLADLESDVILKRMLLRTKKCVVRAYMLDGRNFASRDFGGASDPYLKVKIGEKVFDERDKYIMDEPNPDFFQHYDFEAEFPGCPPLVVEAFDYDDLFGDDLIGTTECDLEDRYFLPEWNALKDKPAEAREIFHPSMNLPQGQIRMWVEINPSEVPKDQIMPIFDVKPKPPEEFEFRVSIFNGRDIKMMDVEDCSDAFMRCFFDSRKDSLETDTHYRLQPGKEASWNYRLVYAKNFFFNKQVVGDYTFTVQMFDRDFFKSNDIIGSAQIDFRQLFEDCALTKKPITLTKTYYTDQIEPQLKKDEKWEFDEEEDSFWVNMISKNEAGEPENGGQIRMRIDILCREEADKAEVGRARAEPNHSPFLPPPVGRLTLSLNPFSMFMQLFGPSMRRKIYCACCCIVCLALCIYILPTIIGGLITDTISSWFT